LTQQFEQCFERWVKQLVTEFGINVIAIDGKVSTGRMTANRAPKLCIVSAWAVSSGSSWRKQSAR